MALAARRRNTIDIVYRLQEELGIVAVKYPTCVGHSQDECASVAELQDHGENLMCLREIRKGQHLCPRRMGLQCVSTGSWRGRGEFSIGVAGYPGRIPNVSILSSTCNTSKRRWIAGQISLRHSCF
jgi:hypothetical protein